METKKSRSGRNSFHLRESSAPSKRNQGMNRESSEVSNLDVTSEEESARAGVSWKEFFDEEELKKAYDIFEKAPNAQELLEKVEEAE